MKSNKFMDSVCSAWLRIGKILGGRPGTVLGIIIGSLIFIGSLTYALVQSHDASQDVRAVTNAFCNGSRPLDDKANYQRCQALLKTLLNNPDPENARLLREIVRNTK